ncbi:MAG: sigma-70 family RNA polymerase sigma factor [Clostridia bacterium]|nr:sigma-70 family RNA polymerase sigma factor [Clostridia bacterium]
MPVRMSGEGGERILLLWERYGGALFRYVRRMLGSGSPAMDAEDIVSEAFLRVMERYERYGERTDEQMKALLLRVCRNLSLDERRRSAKIPEEDPDAADPDSLPDPEAKTPEDLLISEENARRMTKIVLSLGRIYRDVLEMKMIEGLSDAEIAKELGIAPATVRSRLRRARQAAWKEWTKEEGST